MFSQQERTGKVTALLAQFEDKFMARGMRMVNDTTQQEALVRLLKLLDPVADTVTESDSGEYRLRTIKRLAHLRAARARYVLQTSDGIPVKGIHPREDNSESRVSITL